MTSESKILTVSYGTFSCTLEGFDNPFDTMKAIAEYFRDLAAQDRHFGAEPPPPDAAMLHRLAEREVSRMVAAGREEKALLDPQAEAPAEVAADSPRIRFNTPTPRVTPDPVDEAAPKAETPAVAEPSLSEMIPDGVAAKLARIRNAVNPAAMTAPAAAEVFDAPADPLEDAAADAAPAVEPAAQLDGLDDDFTALTALASLEDDQDAAAPGSDDVVARLGALIEDAPATEATAPVEAALAEAEPLIDAFAETDLAADRAEAEAPAADLAEEVDTRDLADLALLDGVDAAPADDPGEELAAEVDLAAADAAGADAAAFDPVSLVAALDDDLPENAPAAYSLDDALLQDPLPEAMGAAESAPETGFDSAPTLAEAPAEPLPADPLPEPAANMAEAPAPAGKSGRSRRVNSRVVRLHPEEDEPRDTAATRLLTPGDEADEVARLMQQADEVMAEDENRRRQEALSRLKAAVAATEADRADLDYEAPKAEANLDPYRDDLAEAIQPFAEEEPPAPEVRPRRKSVTIRPQEPRPGTIRPGMISPPPLVLVSEQRIDRVQPAPAPAPEPAPALAPAAERAPAMAPAAEMPRTAPASPEPMVALRTGRLSGAIGAGAAVATAGAPARNIVLEKPSYGPAAAADEDEDLGEDVKELDEAGLAAFAETVGAKSMADMLEAAAAYATCVENRSQFTRPQLMRRMMASAGGKPVSREDGLRSFGTLLRTGRIEKVSRGHYSLAETSPYLAEARRLT